jgi:hypothetical protein
MRVIYHDLSINTCLVLLLCLSWLRNNLIRSVRMCQLFLHHVRHFSPTGLTDSVRKPVLVRIRTRFQFTILFRLSTFPELLPLHHGLQPPLITCSHYHLPHHKIGNFSLAYMRHTIILRYSHTECLLQYKSAANIPPRSSKRAHPDCGNDSGSQPVYPSRRYSQSTRLVLAS